ncbi:MAG: hypothetical protein K9H25_19500 [Rhodospirillum sp.]|nr:hypothetical protein [Rhodospirillum sp.]MCF8488662.1 hypothetical protein [Rhodospirillum sp.]MCF8503191.1 hypothetical protein [Rhodospirillum sp.]
MTRFRPLSPLLTATLLAVVALSPMARAATGDGSARAGLSTAPGALVPMAPKGMGIHYRMPESWSQTVENGHSLLIQGPRDTPQWYATVQLTNQKNPTPSLPSQGAARAVSDYVAFIQTKGETQEILREAPFHYVNSGPGVDGTQAVTRFLGKEGPIRQWVVAIGRADIPVVHLAIYTAPDDLFDEGLPSAQTIVESITVEPAKR